MTSHIMPAVFKSGKVIGVAMFVIVLGGCVTTPKPPPLPNLTQLQIRQLQSREYPEMEEILVMKAVISALQDEGYIIQTANQDLGLATAAMEVPDEDSKTKAYGAFWYGPGKATYQTVRRLEASATVQKRDKEIRVRINIIAKALTNAGGALWSQPVYDERIYQNIWAKIDKSLFLAKEKV